MNNYDVACTRAYSPEQGYIYNSNGIRGSGEGGGNTGSLPGDTGTHYWNCLRWEGVVPGAGGAPQSIEISNPTTDLIWVIFLWIVVFYCMVQFVRLFLKR